MRITKLPRFSGQGDVTGFFRDFEEMAALYPEREGLMRVLLISNLEGLARDFHRGLGDAGKAMGYEQLKMRLKEHFQSEAE